MLRRGSIWLFALTVAMMVAGTQAASTPAGTDTPCPQRAVTPPSKTLPSGGVTTKEGGAGPSSTEICIYPTINFSASTYSVPYGGSTTLSWSVTDAGYGCQAEATPPSNTWWGARPLNGSESTGPLYTNPTTFYLNCSNGVYGGSGASVSISVGSSGGGGGGGGSCTENDPSQMYATFVSSSAVPTSLTAGQSFAVNITFQNTGQCAWVYGAGPGGYRLGSQNPENNTTWGFSRVDLAYNEVINPGQYKTFTLYATAPSTAGSYGWGWRMVREGVNWLGTPTNPTFTTISVASPLPTVNSFTASPQARWADDPPAALQWDCAGATSASISSNPTTGGSWPNQAPSGSVSLAPPVGDYTYTVVCTNSAGSASQSTKFSVADPDQLRLGSTVVTADNVLSWTASTKIKCFSHYLENQGYNWITRQVKIVVWQDIHWCINTKTKVLACGTQACPLYRTYGHSDPGFPWSWDSWDGSCAAGDCTDYKPLGAFSANIWMTGHIHSCLNVPFVGQVLCKNKSLTVRTIVYGDGTHSDEVIGP